MRRFHIPQSHGTHPNVTPLIDVVMCLIIFFMLVAKIGVSTGVDREINLPSAVLGKELAAKMTDPGNALTLNVRAGGVGDQPMVTALVDGTSGDPQEIRLIDPGTGRRPLLEVLRKLREGDPAHGVNANPEFKVVIRGDREMQYRYLQPVLEACMDAKIKSVNYATQKQVEEVR
jgi:biopolymer transport protein ExbD